LAAAWLTVRYLTPFVLALALALAAEPLVNVLQRRLHLPRWISSGAGVTVTLTVAILLVLTLCAFVLRQLGQLARVMPDLEGTAKQGLETLEAVLLQTAQAAPKSISPLLKRGVEGLFSDGGAVLESLSGTAQNVLANLITIFLGISVARNMTADQFLRVDTLLIMGLGLIAFIVDTAGGVLFAKLLNLFSRKKINPMIGAAGISAFPMSGRIVHKMALEEDPQNFLLMHSIGVNVSGQIASVIAGGIILSMFR
jgi:hypothetical protein